MGELVKSAQGMNFRGGFVSGFGHFPGQFPVAAERTNPAS